MLGQKPKRKIISDEIRDQIRSGELSPGDKLASVKDLCDHFNAGQRTVRDALQMLEEDGLVAIRDRSGCYVESTATEDEDEETDVPTPTDPTAYLMPQKTPTDTIRIYVSDVIESKLTAWREVTRDFSAAQVEIIPCSEGHLEDIYHSRTPDVVETTPEVLTALGIDNFVPGRTVDNMTGMDPAELLAPIRDRISADRVMGGAPFSVSLQYLFVNARFTHRIGMDRFPDDPYDFLRTAKQAHAQLDDDRGVPLTLPSCASLLLMCGALTRDADRGVAVQTERARSMFRLLAETQPPATSVAESFHRFSEGRLAYLTHCSFQVPECLENISFPWHVAPLPVTADTTIPGWLTVLAISRTANSSGKCADLISYLCHPDQQARFARVGGNLPARAAALPELRARTADHLSTDTVDRALSQLDLSWPAEINTAIYHNFNLPDLRRQLSRGEFDFDEILKTLNYHLEFLPYSSQSQ